ncbi:MAG: hypothetical protein ACEY3M_21470 [Wolbachia sp.]
MAKRQPSSRCLLAAEIPRRYDGSRWDDVGLLSSRCLLAGSLVSAAAVYLSSR